MRFVVFLFVLAFVLCNGAEEAWKAPVSYLNVTIGTPGQAFTLKVDSKFEDLLIVGDKCFGLPCKEKNANRNVYFPGKSSTSNVSGLLQTQFGRSTVYGQYVTDSISIGDIKGVQIDIGVLESGNVDFYNIPVDGVIGLSLRDYYRGPDKHDSVVTSLLSSSDSKWINVWTKQATSNADRVDRVSFGKLDSKYCSGTPAFYPNSFLYQFNVDKLRFGTLQSHRAIPSRVDFQQQFIWLPTTEYNQIVNRISYIGNEPKVSCTTLQQINLELKIADKYYVLDYNDYSKKVDSTYCLMLIKDSGDFYRDGNGYILGEPFLRKSCVTFDTQKSAIGFSSSINQK